MAGKRTISNEARIVLKMIEDTGYTIREAKGCLEDRSWRNGTDWNCSDPKRGIRIAIQQRQQGDVELTIKARTDINTYKQQANARVGTDKGQIFFGYQSYALCIDWTQATAEEFRKWLDNLRGEEPTRQLKSKADLAPLNFRNSQMDVIDDRVVVNVFINKVFCKDIVAINDKLQVSQEGIQTPGEECWFLMQGTNIDNNHFTIIVNADQTRFHVLTHRRTKNFVGWQVTNNHRPDNGKMDYTGLTVLDQQAISLAIETYINKHNIAA
jgi:hypothetical protein